jgi:hypothetical protein
MTTPNPTPEKQNSPESPDSERTRPTPSATGFFNRAQRILHPEPQPEPPIHPTEAAEIVIMNEEDTDEIT